MVGIAVALWVAATTPAGAHEPGFMAAYDSVVMLPLSALGSTEDVVTPIEGILVAEANAILGSRLQPPAQFLATDARRTAHEACDGVLSCLVEVCQQAGSAALVVGNVAGLGDERVLSLRLIDVRSGAEIRRMSVNAAGAATELVKQLRYATVTLLAPERLVGAVRIEGNEPGVRLLIDGRLVGTLPLAQERIDLAVGPHAVEAEAEGYGRFVAIVDVAYAETTKVRIALPRREAFLGSNDPLYSRWWTWTLAGSGVVVAGLGGYFNYLHNDAVQRLERRAANGSLTGDHRELYDQRRTFYVSALVSYGIGGLMIAGGGTLLALDFF